MGKTVYLHIGYSKTGTTAIQRFLFESRNWLKSNHRILYPQSVFNQNHSFNHQNLSHSILKGTKKDFPQYIKPQNYPNDPDLFWNKLINEIEDCNCTRIIISSEAFIRFRGHPNLIKKVKYYLKEYNVKIVCYLRRQDDFFESGYNQRVKSDFYTDSIKQFIYLRFKAINYNSDLSEWENEFGKENLIVRIYSTDTLGVNIVHDFMRIFDVSFDSKARVKCINERLPNRYIPLKIFLNKLKISKYFSNFEINDVIKHMGENIEKEYSLLPFKLRNEILEYYEESNKRLAKNYFGSISPFSIYVEQKVVTPKNLILIDLFHFLIIFFSYKLGFKKLS
jgi:hypothetical protein